MSNYKGFPIEGKYFVLDFHFLFLCLFFICLPAFNEKMADCETTNGH